MKNFNYILGLALMLGLGFTATAQIDDADAEHTITVSVPEVAILDLESATNLAFTLEFTADEAGLPLAEAQNTDTWINYTSIISSGKLRDITVEASGAIPSGYILTVAAGSATGGAGTLGNATGEITIANGTANAIISDIGSAYSGDGASNGRQLTYTLKPDLTGGFSSLDYSATHDITVVYTITDDI